MAVFAIYTLASCAGTKPYYGKGNLAAGRPNEEQSAISIFLIGDAGKPLKVKDKLFSELRTELEKSDSNSLILFLGDNIYPKGLPAEGDAGRELAENAMNYQLDLVSGFKGHTIFVPGNHDWNLSSRKGLEAVKREENYVEQRLGNGSFLPKNGCPGPEVLNINKDVCVLLLDTEWWLFKFEKPYGDSTICQAATDSAFFSKIREALRANSNKRIIVAAHHPMYSNGNHGGKFSFVDHVFPLTNVVSHLYLPLPVLGSAYVAARKAGVLRQDITNARYGIMRDSFQHIFSSYPGLIYVSGHEHTLQYKQQGDFHHIVSGAGSKTSYVKRSGNVDFVQRSKGYVRLLINGKKVNMQVRSLQKDSMKTVVDIQLP